MADHRVYLFSDSNEQYQIYCVVNRLRGRIVAEMLLLQPLEPLSYLHVTSYLFRGQALLVSPPTSFRTATTEQSFY